MAHIFHAVALCPGVDVVEREEQTLFACLAIYDMTLFYICIHQIFAPPCKKQVLWLQIVVVVAAIVQILKGEKLLSVYCGCHTEKY